MTLDVGGAISDVWVDSIFSYLLKLQNFSKSHRDSLFFFRRSTHWSVYSTFKSLLYRRLLALQEETGYDIMQKQGQRIFGGPPPGWTGPPPGRGTEIYCYRIPRYISSEP